MDITKYNIGYCVSGLYQINYMACVIVDYFVGRDFYKVE